MKYKVTGTVIITKEITEYFEDDGKTDLGDQANEAIRDSDDIPLSMSYDIEEIDDLVWTPVEAAE